MSHQVIEMLTTGRNGLVIPEVGVDPRYDGAYEVGRFFHRLWEVNGISLDDKEGFYLHELVVPQSAEKPLVVIRGQYTPTTTSERRNDMKSNVRHNMWDNSGGFGRVDEGVVTVGSEEHKILVSPTDGTLAWDEFLSYRYHHKGGARLIDSRQMDKPSISFAGERELREEARGKDWSNNYERQREIFNKGVEKILKQFVELVAVTE
jgi:hypothetical protein